MEPESNQQSMTSGVRFIVPPHSQAKVQVSIYGRCSSMSPSMPHFSLSSCLLPMTCTLPHFSHTHTGSGVPQ